MKKMIMIVAALLALTGCSYDGYTDQSMRTLRYEKGASQGGDFKECLQPGEKIVSNDKFYPYPVSQREDVWDSANYVDTNGNGISEGAADNRDLVVSVDGVDMYVKMKIAFFLNTSCDPVTVGERKYDGGALQAFHELIGKTRSAYFNCDDSGCDYDGGWIWAMTNYITGPAQRLAVQSLNQHSPEDLWQDTALWETIASEIDDGLDAAVNEAMETDIQFYERMQVTITSIKPDPEFLKLYRERQDAQTRADTAEENKAAKIAEAQADTEVAKERAKQLQAEIEGYGGPQWYACIKSIEAGKDCFVPNGTVLLNQGR